MAWLTASLGADKSIATLDGAAQRVMIAAFTSGSFSLVQKTRRFSRALFTIRLRTSRNVLFHCHQGINPRHQQLLLQLPPFLSCHCRDCRALWEGLQWLHKGAWLEPPSHGELWLSITVEDAQPI